MSTELYPVSGLHGPYGTWSAVVHESTPSDPIYAGYIVKVSSENTTELTTTTYKTALRNNYVRVECCNASDDESLVCGIAMQDGTSGEPLALGTQGIFLMPVGAGVSIGQQVCLDQCDTTGANDTDSTYLVAAETEARQIGMALTPASAAGEYILVLCTGIAGHVGAEA